MQTNFDRTPSRQKECDKEVRPSRQKECDRRSGTSFKVECVCSDWSLIQPEHEALAVFRGWRGLGIQGWNSDGDNDDDGVPVRIGVLVLKLLTIAELHCAQCPKASL